MFFNLTLQPETSFNPLFIHRLLTTTNLCDLLLRNHVFHPLSRADARTAPHQDGLDGPIHKSNSIYGEPRIGRQFVSTSSLY